MLLLSLLLLFLELQLHELAVSGSGRESGKAKCSVACLPSVDQRLLRNGDLKKKEETFA
jgi:hypothetical protein